MKHLKTKLFIATSMMLICAMMLSGVSYAWFTLSTNPEISGMKFNVAGNQNLEIALDNGYTTETEVDEASEFVTDVAGSKTGNPYTWGNLVDLGVAFGADKLNPEIQPVKFTNDATNGVKLETPVYGTDGRVSSLKALTGTNFSDLDSISGEALKGGVKGYTANATTPTYIAFSVDFWVRTNVAGNLTLQTAAGVDRADDAVGTGDETTPKVNNTAGAGSYIEVPGYVGMDTNVKAAIDAYFGNMKIAFVTANGATVQATLTKAVAANDNNNWKWEVSINTTDYANGIVTLTRNEAKKISMYVYLDGETISNKEALLADIDNVVFNIQFANTNISGDKAMTGNDA